jgi:hypothetical protein
MANVEEWDAAGRGDDRRSSGGKHIASREALGRHTAVF